MDLLLLGEFRQCLATVSATSGAVQIATGGRRESAVLVMRLSESMYRVGSACTMLGTMVGLDTPGTESTAPDDRLLQVGMRVICELRESGLPMQMAGDRKTAFLCVQRAGRVFDARRYVDDLYREFVARTQNALQAAGFPDAIQHRGEFRP